jgi:soluble lytic murein transglycosylase-like protein
LFLIILAVSCLASAADLAVLRNGNSIRHERRQIVGAVTRLYLSNASNGYIEIPTDQIQRFETDTTPALLPATPPAPLSTSATTKATAPVPPQTQVAMTPQILNQAISGAGERHQLDPDFINSVIRAESGFNNRAVSKKGAQGLMQLMPQTASELGVANPFDPNANVEGGTKYLRGLLEKYNFDVVKALAAYNAGSRRVDKYRGVPPYYETQAYVARIIRDFNRQKLAENPALAKKKVAAQKRATQKSRTATQPRTPPSATKLLHGPERASR